MKNMSGQSSNVALVEQLAVKLAGPVSVEDRRRASMHLLDWAGCAIAGRNEPAGKIALESRGDGPAATAFAWGMLGNILEMDDVDKRAILHPGPSVIPAALALGDVLLSSRTDILNAVVRGYEAVIRLGRAVGPSHYAFWHNTGTCGPIGAAAAGASLMGLNTEQTAHALALATSQAAGVWQTRHEPDSMGKQLHTGNAARAGVDATRLASRGFLGPLTILEGQQGFFAATCPDADPAEVLANHGPDWLIHDVSFKPWPACRHAHAAIDAALLAGEMPVSEIEAIKVTTYSDALAFCDRAEPAGVVEAKFSLQHSVAVALARGEPTLDDFEPGAIVDPDLTALRARTTVEIGEPFASAYPARYGASVLVQRNGRTETFTAPDALGDPENPLSSDDLHMKARTLMAAGGLSDSETESLMSALTEDPDVMDARDMFRSLKGALS